MMVMAGSQISLKTNKASFARLSNEFSNSISRNDSLSSDLFGFRFELP